MPTVTGAGSVTTTFSPGTSSYYAAQQATALINSAIAGGNGVATVTGGGNVTSAGQTVLETQTSNQTAINAAGFTYFVIGDVPAQLTFAESAPQLNQVAILGKGPISFNAAGGSGLIAASDGNDSINIGTGANFAVTAGAGNDTINLGQSSATGRSTVTGGTGRNAISLGAEAAVVQSSGTDTIGVGSGSAVVQLLGTGTASVAGGTGARTVLVGAGTAQIGNAQGAAANVGSTTVLGGSQGSTVYGGSAGNNLLIGGGGTNFLLGAGSGDVLIATGNSGTQVLEAGAGNETLLGSLSSTSNIFEAGRTLNALNQLPSDLIIAGAGNDCIYAGTGSATVSGGGGSDTYIFNTLMATGGQVTITDFQPGADHIHLANYPDNIATVVAAATVPIPNATKITLSDGASITFLGITQVTTSFFG